MVDSFLGAAKNIFDCSSKTCNEAVRGGVWGENLLKGRRHRCKLKWCYKVSNLHDERYSSLLDSEW